MPDSASREPHTLPESAPRAKPLWVLVLILVLLGSAVAYLQFWYPFQVRGRLVSQIESIGGRVEYREVGPEWLRRLTATSHSFPPTGGLLDQVVTARICPAGRPAGGRVVIPEELVQQLHLFPKLTRLDLNYTNATDDWMPHIAKLQSLQRLELGHTRLCGRGFPQLARLPHLRSLEVVFCPIRDQYLASLSRVTSLTQLNLHSCSHVTIPAIDEFRAARPGCSVHVDRRLKP
ncbi:MAG: hypothetical protein KF861_05750 [Planctomycetaceae bacterium]|nr:hypothetical protein [Planctomycetaceae bacterium]